MANTYKWIISSLECYPNYNGLEKIVFNIHWRRQANDERGNIGDVCGMQKIEISVNNNFIPYENLTEGDVIEWLQESIGIEEINAINDELDKQIENQVNPSIISPPLPWS